MRLFRYDLRDSFFFVGLGSRLRKDPNAHVPPFAYVLSMCLVKIYYKDVYSSVVTPVKQLVAFNKVYLAYVPYTLRSPFFKKPETMTV